MLELNKEQFNQLAVNTVNERVTLTGVQPKISLSLQEGNKRLTFDGLWAEYILKPQFPDFAYMPEVEDLTMQLANLFKIATAKHP